MNVEGVTIKRVADVDSFLRAQDDCFVAWREFLAWRVCPNFLGVAIRGNIDHSSFAQRVRILDHHTAPGQPRLRLLIDNRSCTDINPLVYARVQRFWEARRQRHAAAIERVAVVVPSGIVGAVVTGMSHVVDLGVPVRAFPTLESALNWLGCAGLHAQTLSVYASSPESVDVEFLRRFRSFVTEHGLSISLRLAAKRLRMSARTLQRRLGQAGTSFRVEVMHAKLAVAKSLLMSTKLSVTAVALELGFSSLQHFSACFKSVHGDPPSRWLRANQSSLTSAAD
jgi:AraC-like DNA-binding protein